MSVWISACGCQVQNSKGLRPGDKKLEKSALKTERSPVDFQHLQPITKAD